MSALDPSYIRSIRDGIINGNVEANNIEALPDGLVGLYDQELFPPTMKWTERKETLHFFLVFAIAQKEISADFAAAILGDEWYNHADENTSKEEKRLQRVNELIQFHSKRFSSDGGGKYRLYHERFRVYVLQKVSEEDIAQFNDKFISLCETALQTVSEKEILEKESYALEFISTHYFMSAMQGETECLNKVHAAALKKYAYDQQFWERQKKLSQSPNWTNQALNSVLQHGLKYNDNDVFSYASEKIKFIDFYTDELGVILSSIKLGNLDKANQGFNLLFKKGEDGLVQQMNTYIVIFVYAANAISDKIMAKQTLNTILELFSKSIPASNNYFLWSESCVPPVMAFNASIKASEFGCDWKVLWRNFKLENGNNEYFRSFDNDWILNVPLNNQISIEIVSFILKLNSEDLDHTDILRDKAHLRIKIAEKLLINKNEEGKVWVKDLLSNVFMESDNFDDFNEIKKEIAIVLVKTGNIKQAITVGNLIKNKKEIFLYISFLIDYLLKYDDIEKEVLTEIISLNNNQVINFILHLKLLLFEKKYQQVLLKFDEIVSLCKSSYDVGIDIKSTLLPLMIKSATDLNLLNVIYNHYYKGKTDIKKEENIGISFAFMFAYFNKNEHNQSNLIYKDLKEFKWELFEGFNAIYLFDYVKNYLSELEEFDSELFSKIITICFEFFRENPRWARRYSLFEYAKNTSLRKKLFDSIDIFKDIDSLPKKITRDLAFTLNLTYSELLSLENQLVLGNWQNEYELSYLLPLHGSYIDEKSIRTKITNLTDTESRNTSLKNWLYFSKKYDDYEKVCPELLEAILYSVDKSSNEAIPQFVPTSSLYTNQWDSKMELMSEFDSDSKETESIALAMHCASKNDFKTFFNLHENDIISENRLQFNLAFLSYYNELLTILNDKPLDEINPRISEHFTSILEEMKNQRVSNSNPLVTMAKGKGNDLEVIIENLKTIVNSTIEIIKQTNNSKARDGYLLNLAHSASPLISDINEFLTLFDNAAVANCAQLVYLFKSNDQKFDIDEMNTVKKCFEYILSEDDDFYKGKLYTSIYSIACTHVSFPEIKNWLLEPKEKSNSLINLSYKSSPYIRLHFGIYNHYYFALTEIFEGNFDEAFIKVNQITDIIYRESALSVLIVEKFCKGDIISSKKLFQKLTRPEYIEDSTNGIAKCMIHRTNYLLDYSALPTGIWRKTKNIGIFWGKPQNNLNFLLKYDEFISGLTSSLAPLFNAWNFDLKLAKFVVFNSQRDGKALKKLNEAYSYNLKIMNN